jgi:histidinol phosphatase-like enzyme
MNCITFNEISGDELWYIIRNNMAMDIEIAGGMILWWYHCPHMPDDNCECRKPKIGMFTQLKKDWGVDFAKMYYIGDNPSDMEAGKKAGCKTIHIVLPTADSEFQKSEYADETAGSLLEAAKRLIERHGKE